MVRVRRNGRTAAVATVAAASLVGATGASAGGTATAAPAAAGTVDTVDTCQFPTQGLKVGVRLTLRTETDNDVRRIKVRATNKNDTGSFYKQGVTIKKITVTVRQQDGDALSVHKHTRYNSPAYVALTPATGREVVKVETRTEFRLANGSNATANCNVTLEDDN